LIWSSYNFYTLGKIDPLIEGLNEGMFGSFDFIKEVKEKFKIKSLRGKGRPRKEEK